MNIQARLHPVFASIAAGALGTIVCVAPAGAEPKHFACSIVNACLAATNHAGPAVSGTSQSSYGVSGVSTTSVGVFSASHSTAASALYAANDGGGSAFSAFANGSTPGMFLSQAGSGYGIYANAIGGTAVSANSNSGSGLAASSSTGSAITATSSSGTGIQVTSTSGDALDATSSQQNGVFGQGAVYGIRGLASSAAGAAAYGQDTSIGGGGYGVWGTSVNGNAGVFQNAAGDGNLALVVNAGTVGQGIYSMGFFDGNGNPEQLFDDIGNVVISGQIYTSGLCYYGCSKTRRVVTYSARTAEPTLDDDGEAQLVNGEARVRLDSAFANVIDSGRTYMVTVTAEGPSHGLYVAQRDARGFTVRENAPAAAGVAFTYHIVARPYGVADRRLPMMNLAHRAPRAFPRVPTHKPR